MAYLITGGAGHIGNTLARALLKEKKKVKILALPNEDVSSLDGLDVEIVRGDINDREFMKQFIQKDDVVFHLAGIIDIANMPYEKIKKVNYDGTVNVTDACIENKAKKLVYTSTVHIIDPNSGHVLTEPTAFEHDNLVGNYAKTKALASKYITEKSKAGLLDASIVYPSAVVGPYDFRLSETGQVVLDYVNGKLNAYVKGGYNFVDVRDVAQGLIGASEKGRAGEGYILSGNYITVKEMMTILNKKTGRKRVHVKIALWFLKLVAPIANLYYKVRGKKPVLSNESLYTINTNANFSHQKATDEFGYNPRPVEQTLFDTVDWFIENKPELVNKKKFKNLNEDKNV